ncbi:MAG: hypothetical protein IIZ33_05390 [Erysipelotrichaceae bacterium]|nr:hypothetical protein [Erysipelotrichaceae bacterium]
MKNKFVMTPAQNRQFVRARLDDYLFASMVLARYDVDEETCKDPEKMPEGEEKTALLNFQRAYDYLLNGYEEEADYEVLMKLHDILMDGLMDEQVNTLSEEQIAELNAMIDQPAKANTEIAIDVMIHVLDKRLFKDGDVRAALMFADKIMMDKGNGFITVSPALCKEFRTLLKQYNETKEGAAFKEWIYTNCVKGKKYYD